MAKPTAAPQTLQQVPQPSGEPKIGVQRFTIRTESKSFEKQKFRNIKEAKAAVEKYRLSFNRRIPLFEKRCSNHFGPGYKYSGISLQQRAIGFMNEDIPIEKFTWKRLIVEAYLQCIKGE